MASEDPSSPAQSDRAASVASGGLDPVDEVEEDDGAWSGEPMTTSTGIAEVDEEETENVVVRSTFSSKKRLFDDDDDEDSDRVSRPAPSVAFSDTAEPAVKKSRRTTATIGESSEGSDEDGDSGRPKRLVIDEDQL